MKVLRIYWIEKKHKGTFENRKSGRLEHRYSSKERSTDFPQDTLLSEAKQSIYNEHGHRDLGQGVIPKYAEIILHKIVDAKDFEKPDIKSEKTYQDPLFDGMTWAKTLSKK